MVNRACAAAGLVVLCASIAGCTRDPIKREANAVYGKIETGMSVDEVNSVVQEFSQLVHKMEGEEYVRTMTMTGRNNAPLSTDVIIGELEIKISFENGRVSDKSKKGF